ncbi:MAG: hypothetical protein IKU34_00500 [Clostridia bacterium]|nr:hypothetical protein [Clostridia bacterium]
MSAHFNIQAFMEDFQARLTPYCKDACFASGPVFLLLANLAHAYHADDNDIKTITQALHQLGLQNVDIHEDDFLGDGASEEAISSALIRLLERSGLDTDAVYFMGVDEFRQKHKDIFTKLLNIVFFTDKDLQIGIELVTRTNLLLRRALQDQYIKRHPQEAERCLGWVDEETIDIVGPFLKDGHIPSWVYEDVLRDLVADVGNYPLSENILALSLKAMDAQVLLLAKRFWLPVGSDEEAITGKLLMLLDDCDVDLERCFSEGVQAIPRDVLEIMRNIIFFGSVQCASPYEAELASGTLIARIIRDAHARTHLDERVTTDVIDRDMALALRAHAKDGFVPSFVIHREYNRILARTKNAADTAAIRDATMQSLSLAPLLLEEQFYLLPGAPEESIRQKAGSLISGWNLDKVYETGSVPEENTAIHNQLVGMIFFADNRVHSPQEANDVFFDILFSFMTRHIGARGEAVPPQVLSEIETVCIQQQKEGLLPSFLRQAAIDTLLSYISKEWFAEYLYLDILIRNGFDEIELEQKDYLPPDEAYRLKAHIGALINAYGFDLEYIAQHSAVRPDDEPLTQRLANILYFALPACATQQDALAQAQQLLIERAQTTRVTPHRRRRLV